MGTRILIRPRKFNTLLDGEALTLLVDNKLVYNVSEKVIVRKIILEHYLT